jgi:NAD(P)-dependent dehydrogenase (short-subunit alcohol dehydrogenase family)
MKKTVLITGASSGFGRATSLYFASKGWNVVATMRDTSKAGELDHSGDMLIVKLDVQDDATIDSAISAGIERFGRIDVVVNNAGYGLFGIFEGAQRNAIQQQFDVNVFGVMDVTRAVLPHFRANSAGIIINVSSGAGVVGFPMASIYNASKFALEGFSEGLRYELASLGIKVKIVEPGGAGKTNFVARMGEESTGLQVIGDYLPFLEQIGKFYGSMSQASDPDAIEKVVAAIYEAVNDNSDQLRYTPTDDIRPLLNARRSTSETEYHNFTQGLFELKKD